MYNFDDDIKEMNNLADDYPEIVEKLFDIIKKEHSTPQIKRFRMNTLEEIYNTK